MTTAQPQRISALLLTIAVLLSITSSNQGFAQEAPFNKGVNLTNWFQVPTAGQIQFGKYTRNDLIDIKSLGVDVIRLPINLHFMTNGAPDYTLDPLFLGFLDQVVDWAEELEIHLILDNHTFDPSMDTDPAIGAILLKVWRQMAIHYADQSQYIYYEILNEPHGITDELWNNIQQSVVDEIRLHDTTHYLIIGPAGWNNYHNLSAMPVYDDDKLIYTFHFYDPFLLTHQGASWVTPSMVDVKDIPFPYDAVSMPAMPSGLAGSWVGNLYNSYANDGTVQKVEELMDIAVAFKQQRGVPLFCGEFGVFQPNSQEVHRTYWYQVVREYLESHQIAWTVWDYHGGFGLFEEDGQNLFDHDLNIPLLEALGLNVPEQTEFQIVPDSVGFIIYDDFLTQSVYEASYTDGILDYFSVNHPNNGQYCIHWTGASQYQAINLDFHPDRDLTRLVQEGFALDFMVRGSDPGISFDVRFIDTHLTGSGDIPWRMGTTLNANGVSFDGSWHHLHIPLSTFEEKGGWDGQWHNPQGLFDWSSVDKFEIVPEAKALGSSHLYFDNIHITNLDTAQVFPDTTTGIFFTPQKPFNHILQIDIYPNPCPGALHLSYSAPEPIHFCLRDLKARELKQGSLSSPGTLDLSSCQDGLYILELSDRAGNRVLRKIILQKE